jgi:hypothetical protein
MAILHKIRDPGGGSRRDAAFSYASNGFRAVGLDAVPDKLDDARAWGIGRPKKEAGAIIVTGAASDLVFNGGQGIDAWGDFLLDGEVGGLVEEFPLNEYPGNAIEMVGETVKGGVSAVDETPGNSPVYWVGQGIEGLGELVSDPVQFFGSGLEDGGTVHIGPADIGVPGYDVSDVGGYDTEYFDGEILDGWFGYTPSGEAADGAATQTATAESTETATTTAEPTGTATADPELSGDMEEVRTALGDSGNADWNQFQEFVESSGVDAANLPESTEVYSIEGETYLGHEDWGKTQVQQNGLELDHSNGYSESEITDLKDMLGLTTYSS